MKSNPVAGSRSTSRTWRARASSYEAVLEGKLEKLERRGGHVGLPGGPDDTGYYGTLVHMPGFPSGGNSTLVYFVCADCSVEEARVKKNGGRVEKTKFSIGPYGFISLVLRHRGSTCSGCTR
jgi:predicted enzyme related to lactoylglutathione lyase